MACCVEYKWLRGSNIEARDTHQTPHFSRLAYLVSSEQMAHFKYSFAEVSRVQWSRRANTGSPLELPAM